MSSINTLPFLIHTPDLENRAPDEEGGLIPSSPEGHLMKCTVAKEAEAGQGLRGVGPELAPKDHPPGKDAMTGWPWGSALSHFPSLVPCLPRSTYLHLRHKNHQLDDFSS